MSKETKAPLASPTARLALAARQAYLRRRHILGIAGKNVPKERHFLLEAAQKAADCANYLTFEGENELAERAQKVGDAIAKRITAPRRAAPAKKALK